MKNSLNPFLLKGYVSEELFCDRKKETEKLIINIKNQSNTTLFSLRKLGKTGLVQHVFSKLTQEKSITCIYVDLFATQNLHDFTLLLAKAIYHAFPEKKSVGKRFVDTFKSWRPMVTFDPLSGLPELSLDLAQQQTNSQNIPQLLKYLESLQQPIVIAFDEFQQIVFYPEGNVEAILRTTIQHLQNCCFIFSGSNTTLMHQMFNSTKRPFYNSTGSLYLDKIPREEYEKFIKNTFEYRGITISPESISFILDFTLGFTYHTQYICHQLYAFGKKKIDENMAHRAVLETLDEHEYNFFQYRSLITHAQWQLLKAMAVETYVYQPYSKEFIQKHRLGSSAMVKRSLESLLEKELIYHMTTASDKSFYAVYDVFLMRWMQRLPV